MGNPVIHFEIRATDPDATRDFYGSLFGWTYPAAPMPGYTYVDTGVTEGTIPGGIGPTQGTGPGVTVFVGVADVDAALAKAKDLGATVLQPATSVPGVVFGVFKDPQGNVVGVAANT